MWTSAKVAVAGRSDGDVMTAVETYFESRRFREWTWQEPGRSIAAATRFSMATGGEGMKVTVLPPSASGDTEVEVLSAAYALYDWGRNRRNIRKLVGELEQRGFRVEISDLASTHRLGGPPGFTFGIRPLSF
jgi:hypothetical protein